MIHAFGGTPDGSGPRSSLAQGTHGELYGTTSQGGADGFGTAFALLPPALPEGPWTEITLHDFAGGSDGSFAGPLTLGSDGALYGTTPDGGANGVGTIFRLARSGSGPAWSMKTLYAFLGGFDGMYPETALTVEPNGSIFGVTAGGGANRGGAFFEVRP